MNRWPSRTQQERHAAQRGKIAAQLDRPESENPYWLPCMRKAWRDGWGAGQRRK